MNNGNDTSTHDDYSSFSPAFKGKLVDIDCDKCLGTGINEWQEKQCRECNGIGKVIKTK